VVVISIASRQAAISLYPNPAKESLKVVLPSGVLRAALTVYDANGKVVMNTAVNNGEVISISKLPQGMYTVLVQEGEKRWVERLMKL
jgi:membrane carboxypeptidase/penicillin-binding protein